MSNNEFEGSNLTYFKVYCTQFIYSKKDKVHILIVEGQTDEEFYYQLFNQSSLDFGDKRIRFNTQKKQIFADFSKDFIKTFSKSEPYKMNDIKNKIENNDQLNYKGYSFVTECISFYEQNKNDFKNLYCFGIIDKDFGHGNLIEELSNISDTKFHDRETSILRCYLPEIMDLCEDKKKDDAISLLCNIIDTAFKQGIIEELSHDCEAKNGKNLFLRNFTNYYFKNNCDKEYFGKDKFDFEAYLQNYTDYFLFPLSYQGEVGYRAFVEKAKEKIGKIFTFEDELKLLLNNWLCKKELSETDNKRLDRIFKYCNGHILLNQIANFGSNFFNAKSEKELMSIILAKIILKNRNYMSLFCIPPLSSYKKYREENKFYIFL